MEKREKKHSTFLLFLEIDDDGEFNPVEERIRRKTDDDNNDSKCGRTPQLFI